MAITCLAGSTHALDRATQASAAPVRYRCFRTATAGKKRRKSSATNEATFLNHSTMGSSSLPYQRRRGKGMAGLKVHSAARVPAAGRSIARSMLARSLAIRKTRTLRIVPSRRMLSRTAHAEKPRWSKFCQSPGSLARTQSRTARNLVTSSSLAGTCAKTLATPDLARSVTRPST